MPYDYISKLRRGELFSTLSPDEQEKAVFEAEELLKDYYPPRRITERLIALQTLYMLEGEEEEYAKLKRHGVNSASTKGVSVSFGANSLISPDVQASLGTPGAKVGRLI